MKMDKWIFPAVMATQFVSAQADSGIFAMLQKPLIIGASVSADRAAVSPGKKLALRYTNEKNILIRAKGGRTGIDTLAALADRDFMDRTIVLAVDLFFWDSGLPSAKESLLALSGLMEKAQKSKIPVVLGDIPELIPGYQPSRNSLNEGIAAACARYPLCRVIPFNELHKELRKSGSLLVNGQRKTFRELASDGLHLGTEASEFLADIMKDLLVDLKD